MPLPEVVYISKTETLPRELVGTCAKSGCKRCGGAGWFRFKGSAHLWICPCAQDRVRERVAEAKKQKAERRQRPVLELIGEVFEQMATTGELPVAMICSHRIAAEVRAAAGDSVQPLEGGRFRIGVGDPGKPDHRLLVVWPDAVVPDDFSRFFIAKDWEQWERALLEQAAEAEADARVQRAAAAELAEMRRQAVSDQ